LKADLASGLSTLETAYEAALIEQENQVWADEQLRLAQERYRLGAATFLELVEAETVKAQADRDRIAAIFAYHDALASLEALVGTSLRAR
jgi:outer membrane protein